VKYSSTRVRNLINYKTPLIIKKAITLPNTQIELYTLKLYKCMAKHLGRKWKAANCKILTLIYMRLPPDMHGDYLLPESSTADEALADDKRVRAATDDFNQRCYGEGATKKSELGIWQRVARLLATSKLSAQSSYAPSPSSLGNSNILKPHHAALSRQCAGPYADDEFESEEDEADDFFAVSSTYAQ